MKLNRSKMGRHYKKQAGQKRKRINADTQCPAAEIMVGKEKEEVGEGSNKREKKTGIDYPNFPISAQPNNSDNKPPASVICIIERASLEVAKVGKSYQLLHGIKHRNFLIRNGRNPADYRRDIAYLALISIMDTQLNQSGLLKAVYVKTEKGVLIEIKPHLRIPRCYDNFAGLMLQLLQEFTIKAAGSGETLLRTIKNPVTRYLPVDSLKIGFSFSSEKRVGNLHDYLTGTSKAKPLVLVFGAMAHGRIDVDYVDEFIRFGKLPLSAAKCIGDSFLDVYRKLDS